MRVAVLDAKVEVVPTAGLIPLMIYDPSPVELRGDEAVVCIVTAEYVDPAISMAWPLVIDTPTPFIYAVLAFSASDTVL
jgi:hypothetical protein